MKTKQYKIILKLESDLLCGSSGGHATIIDKDIVFDDLGIPYIPAKRIKGILRDNYLMLCNYIKDSKDSSDIIFGKESRDNTRGMIIYDNFYIEEYHTLRKELQSMYAQKKLTKKITEDFFTYTQSFTACEEDTPKAKQHSLRTFRLLKHYVAGNEPLKFEATWSFNSDLQDLMAVLLLSTKRMGSSRLRGLGHVRFELKKDNNIIQPDIETIETIFQNPISTETNLKEKCKAIIDKKPEEICSLPVTIETLSKVIMHSPGGDENMVNTRCHIRASNIIGVLVARYLEKYEVDVVFHEMFSRGKVRFTDALPLYNNKVFFPLIHCKLKDKKEKFPKYNDCYFSVDKNELIVHRVKSEMSFHHAQNKENYGTVEKIFNYRAISPFQQFRGQIIGSESRLTFLKELIDTTERAEIGRAKSAEYGKVSIKTGEIVPLEEPEKNKNNKVYMVLESDTIVYNNVGFSSIDCKDMEKYITGVSNITGRFEPTRVENYMNVWQSKRPPENAFKEGSVFVLEKIPENIDDLIKNGLGERTHEGYGKITFFEYQEFSLNYPTHTSESIRVSSSMGKNIETYKKNMDEEINSITNAHNDAKKIKKTEKLGARKLGMVILSKGMNGLSPHAIKKLNEIGIYDLKSKKNNKTYIKHFFNFLAKTKEN